MSRKYSELYSKLWKLVIPIALQNLMSAVVNASDAVMLGALDQTSLAAVSLGTQVSYVHNAFTSGLTIGTTILAAQYWGKKDSVSVEKILQNVLRISVAVSLAFFLATLFVPEICMSIYTNDPELIKAGAPYLRIISATNLFVGISQVYLCIMKNTERTMKSTIYSSTSMILNVILNAILIYGLFGLPRMGIRGAALATLIARTVELALVIRENFKKDVVKIRFTKRDAQSKDLNRRFWKTSTAVVINLMLYCLGMTAISIIMGHLHSDAIAAHSLANVVRNILRCVCGGIGSGTGIIIGNELGAGNIERAKVYGRKLYQTAGIGGIITGGLIAAVSPVVVSMAGTLSATSQGYLQQMLLIMAIYMIGNALNSACVTGILDAGGDVMFCLYWDIFAMWIIVIPFGALAAFVWHLPVMAVFVILSLDEYIKLIPVFLRFRTYKWAKDLTK